MFPGAELLGDELLPDSQEPGAASASAWNRVQPGRSGRSRGIAGPVGIATVECLEVFDEPRHVVPHRCDIAHRLRQISSMARSASVMACSLFWRMVTIAGVVRSS